MLKDAPQSLKTDIIKGYLHDDTTFIKIAGMVQQKIRPGSSFKIEIVKNNANQSIKEVLGIIT